MSSCFLVAALLSLPGCGTKEEGEESPAVPVPPGGNVIRVDLNLYTPGTIPQGIGEPVKVARHLADAWEKEHPGRRILFQPTVNTGSSEGEWLKTQLMGEIAPEIISQNAEVAWQDTDKGWYVPLDGFLQRPNPYVPGNKHWIDTFVNQALVNAKRAPDGKLYCISMDIVETGIFYNKDLLREQGIDEMPTTWAGMIEMLDTLDRGGVTPLTADGNLATNWGQDIIFEMLYHDLLPDLDILPSPPDAEGYLGHYLDPPEAGFLFTKGFFTRRDPRWVEMYRLLRQWRGYMAKELKNSDPIRMFLTKRLAMYWSGSWFIRRMATDPYIDFDWGVAYIPTITRKTSPFAGGSPATVIGGAAVQLHVTNSAIKNDNLEDCVDFLMYLTAPKNIERLTSEALVFIPNIRGAKMDERLAPFSEIFKRRYCAIKWLESFDGQYKKNWRSMMDYFLEDGFGEGEAGLEAFLKRLEVNFARWVESHRDDAAWHFPPMEDAWKTREARLLRELTPIQ